jgi:hypothetical protein
MSGICIPCVFGVASASNASTAQQDLARAIRRIALVGVLLVVFWLAN